MDKCICNKSDYTDISGYNDSTINSVFPVKFTNSKAIQVMIVGIKIIVMSIMMIKKIRTEPLASLSIISLVGFGIWLWSLTISQKTLLKMVTGTAWEFQYIFFMFICCMVAIWVWLSLWGVKNTVIRKKRENKICNMCMFRICNYSGGCN